MSNQRYHEEDFKDVDGMLYTMPISQIAPQVPMSTHTLRMRCKKLGIKPVLPAPKRKLKPSQINELMLRWR